MDIMKPPFMYATEEEFFWDQFAMNGHRQGGPEAGVAILKMMFQPAEEAPEFPAPPPYFALFTPASSSGPDSTSTRPAPDSTDSFPIEPPPPPPADEDVNIFGFALELKERYTRIVQPEQQLYQATEEVEGDVAVQVVDYKKELKRLNHEVLQKFLSLMDCIKTDPTGDRYQALHEMSIVIDNMYDLLSGYRQHQALIEVADRLKVQLDEKRKAIADLTKGVSEARRRLKEANDTFLKSYNESSAQPPSEATPMDTS